MKLSLYYFYLKLTDTFPNKDECTSIKFTSSIGIGGPYAPVKMRSFFFMMLLIWHMLLVIPCKMLWIWLILGGGFIIVGVWRISVRISIVLGRSFVMCIVFGMVFVILGRNLLVRLVSDGFFLFYHFGDVLTYSIVC